MSLSNVIYLPDDPDEAEAILKKIEDEYYDVEEEQRKANLIYRTAKRCPVCGTPEGFALGTGDCGCLE